jgi:hypothetical protein
MRLAAAAALVPGDLRAARWRAPGLLEPDSRPALWQAKLSRVALSVPPALTPLMVAAVASLVATVASLVAIGVTVIMATIVGTATIYYRYTNVCGYDYGYPY